MKEYQTLSHSVWDCKYHIVFIPKYRQKKLYGSLRRDLKEMFHKLSFQKECRIEEGFLMPDHVHMLLSVPPKYSVAHIVGFLKGKTALYKVHIKILKPLLSGSSETKCSVTDLHLWWRSLNKVG